MLWNSDRKQAFRAALLDVYRSYGELQIFTRDALDKNLEEVASSRNNLTAVVFDLVEWADSKKRLPDLYDYFCTDPDHDVRLEVNAGDRPTNTSTNLGPTNLGKYRRAIPKFVGRDRAMDQLSKLLANNEIVAIAAAVSGMGGLGKTELAWQWAHREYLAGRFPGGVVWLDVAAGNPGEQLVLFCQAEFGEDILPELPTLEERVDFCWRHWADWRSGDVLVVFDDVSYDRDAAKIQELQPGGGAFRTLWTTRDKWAGVRLYPLDKLEDGAARELLASYIDEARLGAEPEAVEKLLRWFEGLPLGLELAARYLALDDWLSVAEYFEELTLTHESLEARPEMRYPNGVEAAIAISWGRLNPETENGQAAQQVAMALGLFGAAPIPVLPKWQKEWRKPLQRLVNLHLVERDKTVIVLHPLVREFVRGQLSGGLEEELRRLVASAILAEGQKIEFPLTIAQAREYAPWIPHLEEVAVELMPWVADDAVMMPCTGIAWFYEGQGMYEAAEPWKKRCVAVARERLGDQHVNTAGAINNLALLYTSQGKYELAEPLYLEALAADRKNLPVNHPSLAIRFNNLAELYRSQGKYGLAKPLYLEALVIDRKSLPSHHPQLATHLNNLALLYDSQGKYELAEPLHQEALAVKRESLPANHPSLAISLNNLANLYRSQGKYELAKPLYQEALAIDRESLPANHPDLAIHLHNLAYLYRTQGKYRQAEPLCREALDIFRENLSAEHSYIAIGLCNLAMVYQPQRKYEEAEPLLLEALAILIDGLGDENQDTQNCLEYITYFYQTALAAGHPDTRLRNHPLGDLIRSRLNQPD
ncbi:MAG: tetratricopeptide repeat protein [Cyanobacteria bacterium P01_D01_bin.73]